jgi:hypothetical protein
MHRRHRSRKTTLFWIPVVLVGILVGVAFMVGPSLLLPPPPRNSPAVGPSQAALAQGVPDSTASSPSDSWFLGSKPAPGASGTQAEPAEQPAEQATAHPRRRLAPSSPAESARERDREADSSANIRWIR